MGHDSHFLRRLERLDHRSLDLALGLYRDRIAVKVILANVDLPSGCDRVALALADDVDPPHVVVARDGGFVTCLGRGMRTGRLPIVSRADIDAAFEDSARVGRVDARIAMRGGIVALLKRVLTAGSRLAREDFDAAALFAPLVQPVLIEALTDSVNYALEVQRAMSLRRLRRTDAATTATLRAFAAAVDTVRHIILLSIPAGQAKLEDGASVSGIASIGDSGCVLGDLGSVAAAACFAAQVGPGLLPGYAARWRRADGVFTFVGPFAGLIGLASAHPDVNSDVLAVFRDRSAPVFEQLDAELASMFADSAIEMLTRPGDIDAAIDDWRRPAVTLISEADASSPADLVDGLLANLPLHWAGNGRGLTLLPAVAAWAGRMEPAQFYLPAETLAQIRTGATIAHTRRFVSDVVRWEGRHLPTVRAQPKVGRNDPCPCGSGRKYKRCCIGP